MFKRICLNVSESNIKYFVNYWRSALNKLTETKKRPEKLFIKPLRGIKHRLASLFATAFSSSLTDLDGIW